MKYSISCMLFDIVWSGNSPRMRTSPFRQWIHFQRLSWFVETCCFQSEFPFYYSFIKFHSDLITFHRFTAGSLRLLVIAGRCFDDTKGWKRLLRLKTLFESEVSDSTCSLAKSGPAGFDECLDHKWKCLAFSAFSVSAVSVAACKQSAKPGQTVWSTQVPLFLCNSLWNDLWSKCNN